MQETDTPWTPHVGDYVLVNQTGEVGEVVDIVDMTGGDGDRRVVIAVSHQPLRDHPPVPPTPPLRTYGLDDVSPVPRP